MKDKKKRIAVIGLKGLPAFGGAAAVGENIIEELKDDFDFVVYSTASHTDKKTGFFNGYKQIVWSSIRFKKLNTLLYYVRSAFHVFFNHYDLVHLHHRDAAFILLLLRLRFPVVLTTHGVLGTAKKWKRYRWFLQLQLRLFVPLANIVTCVSQSEKRILEESWEIAARCIPNGVPSNNDRFNEGCSLSKNRDYIFFAAGRIIDCKGLDILLGALKIMNSPPKLIVAGDLSHEADYKLLVEGLSKGLDVEYVGLIKDKKQLYSLVKESAFFVFPSRQEAMSIMLLEVASLKIPIIASNIEANISVFNANEVKFFESDNVFSLKNAMDAALSNMQHMDQLSKNAYSKIKNRYQWNVIAEEYREVYNNFLYLKK